MNFNIITFFFCANHAPCCIFKRLREITVLTHWISSKVELESGMKEFLGLIINIKTYFGSMPEIHASLKDRNPAVLAEYFAIFATVYKPQKRADDYSSSSVVDLVEAKRFSKYQADFKILKDCDSKEFIELIKALLAHRWVRIILFWNAGIDFEISNAANDKAKGRKDGWKVKWKEEKTKTVEELMNLFLMQWARCGEAGKRKRETQESDDDIKEISEEKYTTPVKNIENAFGECKTEIMAIESLEDYQQRIIDNFARNPRRDSILKALGFYECPVIWDELRALQKGDLLTSPEFVNLRNSADPQNQWRPGDSTSHLAFSLRWRWKPMVSPNILLLKC